MPGQYQKERSQQERGLRANEACYSDKDRPKEFGSENDAIDSQPICKAAASGSCKTQQSGRDEECGQDFGERNAAIVGEKGTSGREPQGDECDTPPDLFRREHGSQRSGQKASSKVHDDLTQHHPEACGGADAASQRINHHKKRRITGDARVGGD